MSDLNLMRFGKPEEIIERLSDGRTDFRPSTLEMRFLLLNLLERLVEQGDALQHLALEIRAIKFPLDGPAS